MLTLRTSNLYVKHIVSRHLYLQFESQFDANICIRETVVCEYLYVQRNVIRRMFVQGHGIMRIFVQGSVVMRIFICTKIYSNVNICTGECSNANIRARECNPKNFAVHMRVCYVRGNSFALLFAFCLNTVCKTTIHSYSMHVFFISVVMILAFLFGDCRIYLSSYFKYVI
jgi:hypothetical protein